MSKTEEALPPLGHLCSISKPLADFPKPVAYINMKTGQVKSLETLKREKPPGQWWPFNVQEEFCAALAQRQQVPEWIQTVRGALLQSARACSACQEGPEDEHCCRKQQWDAIALIDAVAPPAQQQSAQRDEAKRRWISEQDDCNLLEAYDRGWKDRAALAQRQQVPPLSDRCDWCCGTGRFADHACRFCGGKAKGSVFTSQQQQSAQPEQQQQPVVTDAMVAAYLAANEAYWREVDALPTDITKPWRQGTPKDATRVSLEAALAAATQPLTDEQIAEFGALCVMNRRSKKTARELLAEYREELARGIGKQEL